MRTRMPWSVASKLLRSNGLGRARGWNRTVARVSDGDAEYDEAEDDLKDFLEEHIMCGEKIVQIFQLDEEEMDALRDAAEALEVPTGAFSDAYPISLAEDQLASQQNAAPVLVANVDYVDGRALVLASVRHLMTRETVVVAELTDEAADQLAGFNELIGIRHQRLEAFDVLWIPAEGNYVELRVDFPLGTYHRIGAVALERARLQFDALLRSTIGLNQINLFPVLQSLYNSRGDGLMVELAFMIAGSAQKLEKTRRDGLCCREETYHQGGIGVLDAPIQVYKTSVVWRVGMGGGIMSAPEVTISGTSQNTAETNPFLGEMIVRNCARFRDYDHVRDRILSHLEHDDE